LYKEYLLTVTLVVDKLKVTNLISNLKIK